MKQGGKITEQYKGHMIPSDQSTNRHPHSMPVTISKETFVLINAFVLILFHIFKLGCLSIFAFLFDHSNHQMADWIQFALL